MPSGGMEEVVSENDIFERVSTNLSCHIHLAFTAPLCSCKLFADIRFLGDTEQAQQILEGTYDFPPDTDPATKLLLEEASITYLKMSPEEVSTFMTVDYFQHYWQ